MLITEFEELDKRYRANLINSVSGFKSANLIGSINQKREVNLAVFNSVVHIGANPPLLGFVMRPLTVPRHTYDNIKETGYYTINHINKDIYKQAHLTSAKYNKEASEFEQCGLTRQFLSGFKAPFVEESIIKMGIKYVEEHHITANDTKLIIGEIELLVCPDAYIKEDGYVNIEEAGTVAITNLDAYHKTEMLDRLPYAKL